MSKKLSYFELNGLAEAVRYMLYYTGQKFEDVRHDWKTWPIKEVKDKLPFGQLPLLEEGEGRMLHQSIAIARYVVGMRISYHFNEKTSNTELLPSDPWEQALLDAAVLTVYDFDKHFVNWAHAENPADRVVFKKKFYEEHLDFYFSRFEKQVSENNGHFGKKLSWADFVFVGITECCNLFFNDNIEKNYPKLSALVQEVQKLPGVRDYIRERKPYDVSYMNL